MAISFRMPSRPSIRKSGYSQGRSRKLYQEKGFETEEFIFDQDAGDDEIDDVSLHNFSHSRSRFLKSAENDNRNVPKWKDTLKYKIKPGDTLQSISLKYGCSISELKQKNKLISDQDFFALSVLRIPAREHSFLSEVLSHVSPNHSDDEKSKLFHVSIGQMLEDDRLPEARSFLEEMDRDIQRIVGQAQIKKPSDVEDVLSSKNSEPLVINHENKKYDGANWGISWCSLIIVILIVGILAPTLYGIYVIAWPPQQNSTNMISNTDDVVT